MMLIVVVALSTFGVQRSIERRAGVWQSATIAYGVRLGALGLIGVWAAIMVMGRWIAYGV